LKQSEIKARALTKFRPESSCYAISSVRIRDIPKDESNLVGNYFIYTFVTPLLSNLFPLLFQCHIKAGRARTFFLQNTAIPAIELTNGDIVLLHCDILS